MEFTYKAYEKLLNLASSRGYIFCKYEEKNTSDKQIILRHDIDFSMEKAIKMATFEKEHNVISTYFVMLSSGFYNPIMGKNVECLQAIHEMGHQIGLHFDEMNYPSAVGNPIAVAEKIQEESNLLSFILGDRCHLFSYHRPSQQILDAGIEIPGLINSYGNKYFSDYKYVSDSRRRWREPVESIIDSEKYEKIHILTHPFWYEEEEGSLRLSLYRFVNGANMERYEFLRNNFTNIDEVINPEEIQ